MPCFWNDMPLLIMIGLTEPFVLWYGKYIVKRVKYQNIFQAVFIHVPYTNCIICSICGIAVAQW